MYLVFCYKAVTKLEIKSLRTNKNIVICYYSFIYIGII